MEGKLTCPRCKNTMVPEAEPLDVSWAGDGPNAADVDFTGLFLQVHVCPACRATAMRPLAPASPRLSTAAA